METEIRNIPLRAGMGTTAYEIAGYLIREEYGVGDLRTIPEQFRCRVAEWLVEQNRNNYRFVVDRTINIPGDEVDLIRIGNEGWRAGNGTRGGTRGPKGWMLTTTGFLVEGETGWLVDENGLYILQDGRRLNNIEGGLGIGADSIESGLDEILGYNIQNTMRKSEYRTTDLIREYGPYMKDVVYQAFQINICYSQNGWQPCTKKRNLTNIPYVNSGAAQENYIERAENCDYQRIGYDETGIPIVVTRIGPETEPKKLVIAGPHGDERNAQRVIMAVQKHFIENAPPLNTVMYFIPCLSPTMAFADARGIPNNFWVGGTNGTAMRKNNRGKFDLKTDLQIPQLHDAVMSTTRTNIQNQKNPTAPEWGVDGNRDVTLSLKSNEVFDGFIDQIKPIDNNPRKAEVVVYDPDTGDETRPFLETVNNFRILMIHGYDSNQDLGGLSGCVYGPYYVKVKERLPNVKWPARMSTDDKKYVNDIRGAADPSIDRSIWVSLDYADKEFRQIDFNGSPKFPFGNYKFLYSDSTNDTFIDAKAFEGEWSWQLSNKKVWSADIELPNRLGKINYDEGVRGDPDTSTGRPYERDVNVGIISPFREHFINLLENFPWS